MTPVGFAEIDARLGLASGTSRQWARRHGPDTRSRTPFPPIRGRVSGAPAYNWQEILEWMRDTGRVTHEAEPGSAPELGALVLVDEECVPEDWGTAGTVVAWDGQSCVVELDTGHMTEVLPDQLTVMA